MRLLVLFILVPIVELAVIGRVSDAIGLPWTLAVLFGDSLVGAVLVKREGRRAWDAFRQALAEGRWPGDEVAQGALVLVGGALLLTPGFVTDLVGLAAVLPPTRRLLAAIVRRRLRPASLLVGSGGRPGADDAAAVVDVEVVSVDPLPDDAPAPPGDTHGRLGPGG